MDKVDREELLTFMEFDPETSDSTLLGLWLGYPACCINNFVERIRAFREGRFADIPQHQKLDGTGFVPCPACHAAKSEETLREEIAACRVCEQPFPEYEVE
jgi:hypothetical protein